MTKPERRIIIDHHLAPGDVSMMTPLVRDLKLTYGDRFAIDIRTNFEDIFKENPYLTDLHSRDKGIEYYKINYKQGIVKAGRGQKIHFMTEFYSQFRQMSKIQVPLIYPRPDFHLSAEEKANPPISGRYWVVMAGHKTDMTTKSWGGGGRYQQLVNRLRAYGLRFVQCGSTKKMHINPALDNVLNLVGKTSTRMFMNVVYHAEGVICPITFAMHLAGGFEKPCVVIAGGREEPWWEAYEPSYNAFEDCPNPIRVPHRFLHTVGLLKCCTGRGCWRKKTVKVDKDNSLCHLPVHNEHEPPIPLCMDMITVDHAIEAVMSYFEDKTLPLP